MADFLPADVGREIVAHGGLGVITGYTNPTTVTVEIKQDFVAGSFDARQWVILGSPMTDCTPSAKEPVGADITLTLGAAGWRAEDVGKYVRINGGLVKITSIGGTSVANAKIETPLTSNVAAPAQAWTLEGAAWGGIFGWPRCGTLYESRLWCAGAPAWPQSAWGSVSGEPFDFTIGTLDDEAISIIIAGGELNPILHLANARGLVALTTGGEFSIRGGQDKPLTPTSIQVKDQSNYGCSYVAPVRVGQEIYFAQRARRKVRALSPNQYDDGQYVAPDMAVMAEHITGAGVVDMAYQAEPDALLHLVRDDGQMATMTSDRDQEVFAWSRQVTQGAYESVEVVQTAEGDRCFVIVQRAINGKPVRYIEMFDPGLNTDAAVTGQSSAGAATWTGLGHLAGRAVQVKGDGIYLGEFLVTSEGSLTLPRTAKHVEIGLDYVTTVKTLTPEFGLGGGSAAGHKLNAYRVKVRLHDTIGCTVNLQKIAFRQLGREVLDKAPQPFSGDKDVGNLGWGDGQMQTLVQQTLPYDFHLLSVITSMSANEG